MNSPHPFTPVLTHLHTHHVIHPGSKCDAQRYVVIGESEVTLRLLSRRRVSGTYIQALFERNYSLIFIPSSSLIVEYNYSAASNGHRRCAESPRQYCTSPDGRRSDLTKENLARLAAPKATSNVENYSITIQLWLNDGNASLNQLQLWSERSSVEERSYSDGNRAPMAEVELLTAFVGGWCDDEADPNVHVPKMICRNRFV